MLLLTSCSSQYELSHISDPVNGNHCIYRFRNNKGIEHTVVDTIGKYSYGMKKVNLSEIKEMSK